jgi:hypothetical protein
MVLRLLPIAHLCQASIPVAITATHACSCTVAAADCGNCLIPAAPFIISPANQPYVNRAICAQTTPQMLLRFGQDVVALKPTAVVKP